MRIMPRVSKKKIVCDAAQAAATCKCAVPCPGYASREDCPPLIVLAVLATEEDAVFPLATAV